jgi:hypothetical protein
MNTNTAFYRRSMRHFALAAQLFKRRALYWATVKEPIGPKTAAYLIKQYGQAIHTACMYRDRL